VLMFYYAAAFVVVIGVLAQIRELLLAIRDDRKARADAKAKHFAPWLPGEPLKASKLNALQDALKSAGESFANGGNPETWRSPLGVPSIGDVYPKNPRYRVFRRRVRALSPDRVRVEIDYRHDDGETIVTDTMIIPTDKRLPQVGEVVTNGKGRIAIVTEPPGRNDGIFRLPALGIPIPDPLEVERINAAMRAAQADREREEWCKRAVEEADQSTCQHYDNPSHAAYCRFCGARMPRRGVLAGLAGNSIMAGVSS
jgi:hypothetical protein